jgi:hypothetical protein
MKLTGSIHVISGLLATNGERFGKSVWRFLAETHGIWIVEGSGA